MDISVKLTLPEKWKKKKKDHLPHIEEKKKLTQGTEYIVRFLEAILSITHIIYLMEATHTHGNNKKIYRYAGCIAMYWTDFVR